MSRHARNNPDDQPPYPQPPYPEMSDADREEQARQAEAEDMKDGSFPPHEAKATLNEAANLIAMIGTTGTERTDVLRRAQAWLKANGYEHLL